jgi:hypothetical protein
MTQSEAELMFPIAAAYLIHGKGDSTDAPVIKLQAGLEQHWPALILFAQTYLSMTQNPCRCLQSSEVVPYWFR